MNGSEIIVKTYEEFEQELSNILFVKYTDEILVLKTSNDYISVSDIDIDYKNKTLKCNLATPRKSLVVTFNLVSLVLKNKLTGKEVFTVNHRHDSIVAYEGIENVLNTLLDCYLELSREGK